jgi:nucleoside-diphosphate-sugar epimerase
MKVLFTGTSGFLGDVILRELNNNNCFTLNRENSNFNCDLSKTIPEFDKQFDLIIHLAGKAHIAPKTNEDNLSFFQVNVQGTNNLLKALENSSLPEQFVFISSVAVYGLEEGKSITENSPLLAMDSYGLSKIKAEKLVQEWCKQYNVVCTILRLPLVVGANPPGNLGAMIKGIQKGYYFNIAGGQARKSMVLANDVATVLLKASEIGGIYNLTDGYHPNFYELSTAIAMKNRKSKPFNMPYVIAKCISFIGDVVGSKFPLNSNKLKKITSDLTFDDSRAREVLDWKPSKVIDWYNK